ncbi:PTS sugar transporter subunit IIA [Enterococcus faecium]|uniref:PTS sugar transporter subunit IIA n=1 Tax=Enterococcus faecium TaxID=1352 RepID=UPI000CF07D4D|nr:PTS sugar transporter subunit IIA [Enterococcus faecium]EGP4971558.1 PTS sugar transporter subunit IIA [Enterococcus faecium]EMF0387855.1 PTS sugar transporter subunit IIA [Enterococcus faecium]MBD9837400.1 PTS sugar transporter subunit IIA [Enterococcus faecium]MDQ8526897.1 PTS sugar transporter subunit IIA [Enterococcus faecium]MDT6277454.1 PTS sugar transporter subunit IIA [Enterococcus faecium]
MNKKMGVILASHGFFAKEALNSLEMIQGDFSNARVVSLFPGMSLADFVIKIEEKIEELDTTNGLLIICDIFGGTPSNAAAMILIKYQRKDYYAFAGFNLGILLELSNFREKAPEYVMEKMNELMSYSWKQIETPKPIIEKAEGL